MLNSLYDMKKMLVGAVGSFVASFLVVAFLYAGMTMDSPEVSRDVGNFLIVLMVVLWAIFLGLFVRRTRKAANAENVWCRHCGTMNEARGSQCSKCGATDNWKN